MKSHSAVSQSINHFTFPLAMCEGWIFPHPYVNTYCFLFVITVTSGGGAFRVGMKWHLVVLTCISMTGEVERPVVLWPLMYLLWRKTYSSPFPMFELGWLIFCQVVGVFKNISWILIPYWIYDW